MKQTKNFLLSNKRNPWFWTFVIFIAALFVMMPLMSLSSGNSGDEDRFQVPQGKNVVNYFKTDGQDTSCMSFENLKYYGSSPDVIMEYVNQTCNVEDISKTRHVVNSILGWLAILFVGLLAYIIGGWRAAVMAVLLMFLSPRFLGHSFNNSKDIPFAASVIGAIYFMVLFFKQFPKVKISTIVLLILCIGFSISVRIGGLILYAYLGLFAFIYILKEYIFVKAVVKDRNRKIGLIFVYGLGIAIISYFLGLVLWPYALQAPIKNPMEAFFEMSKFSVSIRQNFEGSMQWSDYLPWYYTPKFILMTIPLAIIIGLILFFTLLWKDKKNYFWYFIVFFTFFFPIFWIIYTKANVYGGWRHAIFAYPAMVLAAALGFNLLIDSLQKIFSKKNTNFFKIKLPQILGFTLLAILLIQPVKHIIKNHPYEYVYFNFLFGGLDKAYGNYELDYYYHSTREASEWILKNAEKTGLETGDKIIVATWHTASVGYFFRNDTSRFSLAFSRWHERGNNDWDYAIFTVTGMSPGMLKSSSFPPANTVYQVKVDDKPICLVLKRTDKSDFYANKAKAEGRIDTALALFTHSLKTVPTDESVLLNLSEIYLQRGAIDSALMYMDKLLSFDPKNESALYMKAYALMNQNRLDEALVGLNIIVDQNPKNGAAPWLAANLYANKGDFMNMEKMLELALIQDPNKRDDAHLMMQRAYAATGMGQDMGSRSFVKIWIRVLETLGYQEEADRLKTQK